MAIVNGDNFSDYDKVQEIIIDVLTNRKLLFRKDVIIKIIKDRLIQVGIDSNVVNEVYFNILFDEILTNMINNGIIYNDGKSKVFEPIDYIIFNNYIECCSRVLYLSEDNKKYNYVNITNGKREFFPIYFDYVLTGGLENGRFISPQIPYEEIKKLYDDCIMEGASKRDALDHVLNFYSIKHLYSSSDGFHTVCISEKKRKKPSFSYSLKKDTKQKKWLIVK